MSKIEIMSKMRREGRTLEKAIAGDDDLGPLKHLPGTWSNQPNLQGRGWNIIALPFATEPGEGFNYRVLMNQYNEDLVFSTVDKGVPNRGIRRNGGIQESDQFLVALDYQQSITQIAAADSPDSGLAGPDGLAIHHEPGLWLHMLNETTNELDIARLGTIPHGDSVLALGESKVVDGLVPIPGPISALPIGVSDDLENNPYLAPYKRFVDAPFKGVLDGVDGFPGFLPNQTEQLLNLANQGLGDLEVRRTTVLDVDSTVEQAGVVNIPFIVKQANAASMKSTFWIQELENTTTGETSFRLQYLQVVLLDFFNRRDGMPGLIRWPHISINTLEKVSNET